MTNTPAQRLDEEVAYWQHLQIAATKKNLASKIQGLKRDLDHALLQLEEGYSPNPLGICQRQAQDIDRLCAQLDTEQKALSMLQHLAKELAEG